MAETASFEGRNSPSSSSSSSSSSEVFVDAEAEIAASEKGDDDDDRHAELEVLGGGGGDDEGDCNAGSVSMGGEAEKCGPAAAMEENSEIVVEDGVECSSRCEDEDTGSRTPASSSLLRGLSDRSSSENNIHGEPSTSNHLATSSWSRRDNPLSVLVARLFDEKVPIRKKLKWLNRMATVKEDGTVQFEVPGDIKPNIFDFSSGHTNGETRVTEQVDSAELPDLPPLQIVMLIVGTRGDAQSFVAIGKRLQEYGHRVRLATHINFKEFVLTSGLEFFPLGGDPKVLAGCN